MEGFCRACLIKYDDPMDLLQYTEKNRRMFVYSTGLQVKRNDTLMFQLCKDCILSMKQACKFKKQCRTSDKRVKNYLGLKDVEDTVDFCTFLKNSEEALTFRLPLMSGNSTPANQKSKEDDNESTCTSIRNFMTDILQGEEVPDTEARIIRELIEEEADVLDDSLDSHWLQDDNMSVDTDFRLDFSFSPFSTPRSVNNNQASTPKRYLEEKQEQINYYTSKMIENNHRIINDISDTINKNCAEKEFCDYNEEINDINNLETLDENIELMQDKIDNLANNIDDVSYTNEFEIPIDNNVKKKVINAQNFYMPQDSADDLQNLELESNNKKENSCSIDRNLEKALKDASSKEFLLDNILTSPSVYKNTSGASTPTIRNILFGEKLDIEASDTNRKPGYSIENYQNVQGDIEILDEFFKNDAKAFEMRKDYDQVDNGNVAQSASDEKSNVAEKVKIESPKIQNISSISEEFDMEKFICHTCDKKFHDVRCLKIHMNKAHKIKVLAQNTYKRNPRPCPICGQVFKYASTLYRHIKTHQESIDIKSYKCSKCALDFKTKGLLYAHEKVHTGIVPVKRKSNKDYLCTICGFVSTTKPNHDLHMRRHTKNYSHVCKECNKGFYRNGELDLHIRRKHTGETPHKCTFCSKSYAQRSEVLQHIRSWHLNEKIYECHHCSKKYLSKSELRLHLKDSKKCKKLQTKGLETELQGIEDEEMSTERNETENVTEMFATSDIISINNQLPLIDTEMDN